MELMWKQRYLLAMSVPFLIWLFIFKYVPLWGWTMAFQEVVPKSFAKPIWERKFIGFDNFIQAFTDRLFAQTMINTIGISIMGILIGTAAAIIFALFLNEIRMQGFKKLTQTVSYLPHFVSWVIIASIAKMLLNDGGAIETMFGVNLHLMSTNSPLFWIVVCFINVWKEVGWDAILYLSAMAGIDQGIYEGIKPTAIVLLIMSVGSALNVGMERQMLLSNGIVQDHAMVLSWFAYIRGIGSNNYGLGTAIGMFQSVVGLILLFIANKIAGMVGESKLV